MFATPYPAYQKAASLLPVVAGQVLGVEQGYDDRVNSPISSPQAACEADLAKFNQLVQENQDAAYRLACYLMGDEDDAEDVTQTAFLKAYLNFQTFRGKSFCAWLLQIVKNTSFDELRRRKRRRYLPLETMEAGEETRFLTPHAGLLPTPEQVVEQKEIARQIEKAILSLPEKYGTVLVLVDLQDLDYREAAEVIQKPVGTVKSRLARARLMLKAVIKS